MQASCMAVGLVEKWEIWLGIISLLTLLETW
jgi:hypothetical protein